MFDSAAAERSLGPGGIEALTQATASRFSTWFGPGSERKLAWLRYFDLLHRDPAGFSAQYAALLRNGYDAPPDPLLRRFVGISLDVPELVQGASRVLETLLRELNSLYAP